MPKGSKKILIVDDEIFICEAIAGICEDAGYDAKHICDADEILSVYGDWCPDLIITDLGMPGKSGCEVIKDIRKIDFGIPIILLTGWANQIDVVNALRAGCDIVLGKPISSRDLSSFIERYLNLGFEERIKHRLGGLEVIIERQSKIIKEQATDMSMLKEIDHTLEKYKTVCSSIAHDLANELVTINLNLDQVYGAQNDQKTENFIIKNIKQNITYSNILIDRLRQFLDVGDLNLKEIDIIDILQKTELIIKPRLSPKLTFLVKNRFPNNAYIMVDQAQFIGILVELILNANKAMKAKGGIIELSFDRVNGYAEFCVKDNGPGFPQNIKDEIFIKQIKSKSGIGLGLFLSKKLVNNMGGELVIDEHYLDGVQINIRFQFSSNL